MRLDPVADNDYAERLAAHLEHENTRQLLTVAGLFLVAFELVNSTVIGEVKGFLCSEWDHRGKPVAGETYQREVLSDRSVLAGSLGWLVRAHALTQDEADSVDRLRRARNRVAHQIPKLVADPDFDLDVQPLVDAGAVLKRLAVFFGSINVNVDPDFDHREVDYEGIESGVSLLYSHVLTAFAVALEDSVSGAPADGSDIADA